MTPDPVFVLVHGAWHVASSWDPLVRELAARGLRAVPVDLPSDRPGVGAAGYADAVLAAMLQASGPSGAAVSCAPGGTGTGEAVVVVGHSLGGLTAPLVAQRLGPGRVTALFLVAPLLPGIGTSSDECSRAGHGGTRPGFGRGQVRHDDRTTSWPPPAAEAELYAGVAEELGAGGAELLASALAGLRPQAWTVTREVTPLTSWPAVPTTVIVCGQDRVVDPERLRVAAGGVPGATVVELSGGHFPQLTRPAELADVLTGAS